VHSECVPFGFDVSVPSFYHGEKMWKILVSELVHEAAVQGGCHLIFLRKSENRDKMIVQYTIGCVRYKVYGENKKKVHNANNSMGKTLVQIGSMHCWFCG
jgi:hypothetical protein